MHPRSVLLGAGQHRLSDGFRVHCPILAEGAKHDRLDHGQNPVADAFGQPVLVAPTGK